MEGGREEGSGSMPHAGFSLHLDSLPPPLSLLFACCAGRGEYDCFRMDSPPIVPCFLWGFLRYRTRLDQTRPAQIKVHARKRYVSRSLGLRGVLYSTTLSHPIPSHVASSRLFSSIHCFAFNSIPSHSLNQPHTHTAAIQCSVHSDA
jgi:hypothetical protein